MWRPSDTISNDNLAMLRLKEQRSAVNPRGRKKDDDDKWRPKSWLDDSDEEIAKRRDKSKLIH